MGKRGANFNPAVESAASSLIEALSECGDVSGRRMFGGVGVFCGGTMFGIVDSTGAIFLRAGPSNQTLFDDAGSERHGRMPYYSVPAEVLNDAPTLVRWGHAAIEASREAKAG